LFANRPGGREEDMAGLTVPKGKAEPAKRYTNIRLYEADAEDLASLAAMEGTTVADAYHKRHAARTREERIEKAEKELKRLRGQ
jgi:hypothetical protein